MDDKNHMDVPRDYAKLDPLTLLEELRDCIKDQAYREAVLKLAAYYRWRLMGGFEPIKSGKYGNTKGDKIAQECAASLADALG